MHLVGKDSIIIGIDVHKYIHQAVALSCFGEELGKLQFSNDEMDKCFSWLNTFGEREQVIVGLEDVNGLGIHLNQQLQTAGFHTRYIPAVYTERSRKHSPGQDKNDYLDAKRVGKVILQQAEETLPAKSIVPQETIRTLDLLLQEKEILTREQTALKNQLHGLLHQYYGNGYKQTFKDIFSDKAIFWYLSDLKKRQGNKEGSDNRTYVQGSIVRRFERLQLIVRQVKELVQLITENGKTVTSVKVLTQSVQGCGILTACKVIVEVGNVGRFQTEAKLAKYAGIAPKQSQSGSRNRYHTNPFGNRKLNVAVNTIALYQIGNRGSVEGKKYYQKKIAEGKSKLWAMRCLKRFIIRRIFVLLHQSISHPVN
jgi:transposase